MDIPVAHIHWKPCWRIIPSRFPPIQLFERVADPADLDAVIALETLTNPRIRDEIGEISLIPLQDRISGPGSSMVMAAFTHFNPDGSRFADGTYGVYYAAGRLETAIAETVYHSENFMRATAEKPMELDRRVYLADVDAEFHDIRGRKAELPSIYHREDYSAGRALAGNLRREGSNGIAYDSVRDPDGECLAVFRPKLVSRCRQERHLCYIWDGARIKVVYEKRQIGLTMS